MMKKLFIVGIAMMTIAISSCDKDTTQLGYTLTSEKDQFKVLVDTFDVSTRSVRADSVLSRSAYSYLGRIKDPETGAYITSDYMTQFNVLENESKFIFQTKDSVISVDANGEPQADSCYFNIILSSYQGDSLAAMKLAVLELDKPVEDGKTYYTTFDPVEQGYIREGGLAKEKLYSIIDLTLSDSIRNIRRQNNYYERVMVPLNQPYTDKEGNTYNNYGTYLMRTYYAHPEYFRSSIAFAKHVCPGFYVKTTDGLGVMAEVISNQLVVSFRFKSDTVTYTGERAFFGTQEVLQTTHITNEGNIDQLVNDQACTYLKTPAGIFTEVTLPVDDIKLGHEKDTITSAKIVFQRLIDYSKLSDYIMEEPQNLLMVEADSLTSFFENNSLNDNKSSFIATFNSQYNTYSFNNISNLINKMYLNRNRSANWNKVVLVPVKTSTSTTSATTTITGLANEMAITSIRLVGGKENTHAPVRISVIYNSGE